MNIRDLFFMKYGLELSKEIFDEIHLYNDKTFLIKTSISKEEYSNQVNKSLGRIEELQELRNEASEELNNQVFGNSDEEKKEIEDFDSKIEDEIQELDILLSKLFTSNF